MVEELLAETQMGLEVALALMVVTQMGLARGLMPKMGLALAVESELLESVVSKRKVKNQRDLLLQDEVTRDLVRKRKDSTLEWLIQK